MAYEISKLKLIKKDKDKLADEIATNILFDMFGLITDDEQKLEVKLHMLEY